MGFNPDQPRDPAGTSTGGEWTSGGSIAAVEKRAKASQKEPEHVERLGISEKFWINEPTDVYVNPGKSSLKALFAKATIVQDRVAAKYGEKIRSDPSMLAIKDKQGNYYFWNGNNAIHDSIMSAMSISKPFYKSSFTLKSMSDSGFDAEKIFNSGEVILEKK